MELWIIGVVEVILLCVLVWLYSAQRWADDIKEMILTADVRLLKAEDRAFFERIKGYLDRAKLSCYFGGRVMRGAWRLFREQKNWKPEYDDIDLIVPYQDNPEFPRIIDELWFNRGEMREIRKFVDFKDRSMEHTYAGILALGRFLFADSKTRVDLTFGSKHFTYEDTASFDREWQRRECRKAAHERLRIKVEQAMQDQPAAYLSGNLILN